MEIISLEGIWKNKLESMSWPQQAIVRFNFNWAPTTLSSYNNIVCKLSDYCSYQNIVFPPTEASHVAGFLVELTNNSDRPRSILKSASAAFTCLYDGLNMSDINPVSKNSDLRRLSNALVKTGTVLPRSKTPVMPVKPLNDLFLSWDVNSALNIKQLRQKSLALLAISLMLRPSDVAPRSKKYSLETNSMETMLFKVNQIQFHEDGSATLMLHGIKNDYMRDGFQIELDKNEAQKLDPVSVIREYINRTSPQRSSDEDAVFLSLNAPYKPVSSTTVAKILNEVIDMAGLDSSLYTAKCFRPSGATKGIESNCNPDALRQVGRWRNREVFEAHYVHSKAQKGISNKILETGDA